MEKILDRFLRYVAVDTQSDPESESQPSAAKELNLSKMLFDELVAMGVDATLDEYGYVMASIPSNCSHEVPAIGFIAHVDTAPDAPGADVKPQIIENYDGGEIALHGVPGLSLKPEEFPELLQYRGQTIITTDGTTLLGADDKAGIAEIMDAVQYIVEHPEFKHGDIKIGFTPDEEIGRGVVKFDVQKFGAKFAYTLDGGPVGELEYENFNAASATIHIQGLNVHPGTAKGKMKNASLIGMELNDMLPAAQRPEHTEGYEGFYHLIGFKGEVETATFSYIIRDHNMARYEQKKEFMQQCVDRINRKYGEGTATLELKHQYYNMRKQVEPHYHIIERAMVAMEMEGITPNIKPIRGGTDGANLSFMGLPCPNIFAGGHNFHGKMEYIPLESMEKASKVILNIAQLFAESPGEDFKKPEPVAPPCPPPYPPCPPCNNLNKRDKKLEWLLTGTLAIPLFICIFQKFIALLINNTDIEWSTWWITRGIYITSLQSIVPIIYLLTSSLKLNKSAKSGALLCALGNGALMLWYIFQCICFYMYNQDYDRFRYFIEANDIGYYVLNTLYILPSIVGTILLIFGSGPKIRTALKVVLMIAAAFTLTNFLSEILYNMFYREISDLFFSIFEIFDYYPSDYHHEEHYIISLYYNIVFATNLIVDTLLLGLGIILCATGKNRK